MSGSDIKEACRDAAMAPVREFIREHRASGSAMSSIDPKKVRGMKTEDFFGRKGGGQILLDNHSKASAKSRPAAAPSSTDEYEDVEEGGETTDSATAARGVTDFQLD